MAERQRPAGSLHAPVCPYSAEHLLLLSLAALEEGSPPVSIRGSPSARPWAQPGCSADNHCGSARKMSMAASLPATQARFSEAAAIRGN